MQEQKIDRLRPSPTQDTKPYWDGLLEGHVLIQQCADCSTFRHYPRPVCPECHSMAFDWREISGNGTVHSWTVSGFARRYAMAIRKISLLVGKFQSVWSSLKKIWPPQLFVSPM